MSLYLGLNRRSSGDRRVFDRGGGSERSVSDRRRDGTDRYVLVFGPVGIDRFGLMVGLPVVLLSAVGLVNAFVHS